MCLLFCRIVSSWKFNSSSRERERDLVDRLQALANKLSRKSMKSECAMVDEKCENHRREIYKNLVENFLDISPNHFPLVSTRIEILIKIVFTQHSCGCWEKKLKFNASRLTIIIFVYDTKIIIWQCHIGVKCNCLNAFFYWIINCGRWTSVSFELNSFA